MTIDEFEVSIRVYNCLKNAGVQALADLLKLHEVDLLRLPNFGRKSLQEVREWLANNELKLSDTRCPCDQQGRFIFGPEPAYVSDRDFIHSDRT